jgi:hypothetical protein
MNYITTNLRTNNVVHNFNPFTAHTHDLVRENKAGYRLPPADAYARRIAEEAEAWLDHARERSRMKGDTLVRKALSTVAFTLRHRAHDLAVPTKLVGTSKHQPTLWQLVRSGVGLGTALDVEELREDRRVRLVVSIDSDELGEVQSKHVAWLRPLLPFSAGLYLVRVTGQEGDFTLGCNVAVGRVGGAVEALRHALGSDVGGDGYGGDGASQAAVAPVSSEPRPLPAGGGGAGGDGAAGDPEAEHGHDHDAAIQDVVLYRGIDGAAHAALGARPLEHVVRHSPSGIEWGYGGSGPADLARSILFAFTDEATAERHCVRFKDEFVAAVPRAGGVIRGAAVLAFLAACSSGQR